MTDLGEDLKSLFDGAQAQDAEPPRGVVAAPEVVAEVSATQVRQPRPAMLLSGRGIEISTFDELWRFSKVVLASGLAPKDFKSPEACFIAIEMGLELGLSPMLALQNISPINGRPMIWGDLPLALCSGSGLLEDIVETVDGEVDKMVATCTVKRYGRTAVVRTFSVADAKQARLWGKEGPWTQYPRRLLQLRARAFGLRDTFADVLRGIGIKEEWEGGYDTITTVAVEQLGKNKGEAILAQIGGAK